MKILDVTTDQATLTFSTEELGHLCSALSETLQALEEWEFHPRTVATRVYDRTKA